MLVAVDDSVSNSMNVSFVVIGLNEERFLESCFSSIKRAIDKLCYCGCELRYEVIYVDSGSIDKSVKVADEFSDFDIDIYELTGDKSASAARKVGEINSKYDYLLFLDGDMELDSDFLCLVDFDNVLSGEIGGVVGRRKEVIYPQNDPPYVVSQNFYSYKGVKKVSHIGGAMLVSREALVASGGFCPKQKMWEEQRLLAMLMKENYVVISMDIPFITHNNKKKKDFCKIFRSYLTWGGTGYFYAMYLFDSISDGAWKPVLYNQKSFFIAILVHLFFVVFTLFGFAGYLIEITYFVSSFVFSPKLAVHANLRLLSCLVYAFSNKCDFDFSWAKKSG